MKKIWLVGLMMMVLSGCGLEEKKYINENFCQQFSSEFMEKVVGQPIIKAEKHAEPGLYGCNYYIDDKNFLRIVVDFLSVDNQKEGQISMGRKAEINGKIAMRNLVITQKDGLINSVYLIFNDQKYLTLEFSPEWPGSTQELIKIGSRLADEIKDYQ